MLPVACKMLRGACCVLLGGCLLLAVGNVLVVWLFVGYWLCLCVVCGVLVVG